MKNYLIQLKYMGLTPRIKRLSDRLLTNGRELYQGINSEIEPNWFLIFTIALEDEVTTISELTQKLGFSHPSIIAIVKKMQKKGYLDIRANKKDKRKQEIRLSKKAKKEMEGFQKTWLACGRAVESLFISDNFLHEFERLEKALERKSFKERVEKQLLVSDVSIVKFQTEYVKHFGDLNKEWISNYFKIEMNDNQLLDDPEKYIIQKGGEIIFALENKIPIGTAALIHKSDGVVELARMAVRPDFQGKGIGTILLKKALDIARSKNYKKVILYSSTILASAIYLYAQYGFMEEKLEDNCPYERANIKMVLLLN
jgi:GNAT superfamily N-acetyltransferase/DNA-binding MarR family transcriptional regulator